MRAAIWEEPGQLVVGERPDAGRVARYDELYATYRSLYPALREAMHALSAAEE